MKRGVLLFVVLVLLAVAVGCSGGKTEELPSGSAQIANPWKTYETLEEAEAAVGFELELGEIIADSYCAEIFRVMNGSLLEVVYSSGDDTVTVRKAAGEEDISGDYSTYEEIRIEEWADGSAAYRGDRSVVICRGDFSYSLYAPEGFREGIAEAFVAALFGS